MGEIHEAEHAELGRRVALKVLHGQHLGRADLAARLRAEARLLARLRHPNLVEVYDLGVTADGRPWFAMPLLHGCDLRDLLSRRGPLPAPAAASLLAQALDGLAQVHAAGFVHRDVKLENLFLETDGTVKVLDFGIAKIAHAAGATDPGASPGGLGAEPAESAEPAEPPSWAGTPRTMAPEQCAGGAVDPRADLYAVGLALYELCTGRGPFDDLRGQDHALRFAHCRRPPAPPSALAPGSVPPWLDAIVLRAIAKDPGDRFQTALEMAAALRAHGRSRESPPVRARHRPWMATMASALAIAGFALGLLFGRAERSPRPSVPSAHRMAAAESSR
jgi:serine/threonine protein kinase